MLRLVEAQARVIGENVTRLAEAKGLSLRRLSRWADVSPQTIGDVLHGKANPTVKTLVQIAAVLEVEPWELLRPVE
ncbi:MAG: helix-turn-helix transcriptional regulator [Phycisphaerales bacterium]|nr:helix-turn-helix transcriptional regulator [Phycisphaerales bacterium]